MTRRHLSLVLLAGLLLPACAGGSRAGGASGDPPVAEVANKSTSHPPTAAEAERLGALSREQLLAPSVSQSLREGNPYGLRFAQRLILDRALTSAFNGSWLEQRTKPDSLADLGPFLAVWPLTEANEPWPLRLGEGDPTYPSVTISEPVNMETLKILVYDWDPGPWPPPLQLFFRASADQAGADALKNPNLDDEYVPIEIARGLLKVIAHYQVDFGHYPSTPALAFEELRFAIVGEPFDALATAYDEVRFLKSPGGNKAAMLFQSSDGSLRLLVHENRSGGSAGLSAIHDPVEIDQELAGLEPWGTLADLQSVKRLSETPLAAIHPTLRESPAAANDPPASSSEGSVG